MTSTLPDMLNAIAAEGGSKLACPEGERTYAELRDSSARVASGLQRMGVGHGDRVALYSENGFAWLALMFACARLGAIAVAVNSKFRSTEVSDIVTRAGCSVICLPGDDPVFRDTLAACETLGALKSAVWLWGQPDTTSEPLAALTHTTFEDLDSAPAMTGHHADPDTGCMIFTTSGTTSKPKFVLHRQSALIAHGRNVARAAGIGVSDTVFQLPPFCGTFGLSTTFSALATGAGLVIPRMFTPDEGVRSIARTGATHTMATNDGLKLLIDADPDGNHLKTLRYVGMAATNPVLGPMCREGDARGITVSGMYGSSEVQAIISLQSRDASTEDRQYQGGALVSDRARVRVCDPQTGKQLDPGETGEIEIHAPDSQMIGYFGNPEATANAFREDGFFRTGDFGYMMEDGRFVFLGRMGDSLRLGGFLVDPREIEMEVETLPGVAEAQVVGIETPRGLRPVAFVIAGDVDMPDEEAMKALLSGRLAKFKVPVRFHVVDDFPKTVSANAVKIQKGKLREMAQTLSAPAT